MANCRPNGSSFRCLEPSRLFPGEPTMTNPDRLPYVEAELNYLAPMTERPRYYAYDGAPSSNLVPDPHQMRIHHLRPIMSGLDLDIQGFALVAHRDPLHHFS